MFALFGSACGVDGRALDAFTEAGASGVAGDDGNDGGQPNDGGRGGSAGRSGGKGSGKAGRAGNEAGKGGEDGPNAAGQSGAGEGGSGQAGNGGSGGNAGVSGNGGNTGSSGGVGPPGGSSGAAGSPAGTAGTFGGAGQGGSAGAGGGTSGSGGKGGNAGGGGVIEPHPDCGDLNHDAVDDCAQTILDNARFDRDLDGWSAEAQTTVAWDPRDASEDPRSGAVSVTFASGGGEGTSMAGVNQCIRNVHVAYYELGTRLFVENSTDAWGTMNVLFFGDEDCTGALSFSRTLPLGLSGDGWSETAAKIQVPPAVRSLLVRLVVVKPDSEPSATVVFDSVLARPR